MQPEITGEILNLHLSELLRRAAVEGGITLGIRLLSDLPGYESIVAADVVHQMQHCIRQAAWKDVHIIIPSALKLSTLREYALERIGSLSAKQLIGLLTFEESCDVIEHGPELRKRAIILYLESSNYDDADSRFNGLIKPILCSLTILEIEEILKGSFENGQIHRRGRFPTSLKTLSSSPVLSPHTWNELIEKYDPKSNFAEVRLANTEN